jgi:histidine kinase/DNA gyrase B/HSP90-like ATPase
MVSTKRAATLTHRLLAFSRRQMLDPTPTDVNRLVADMEDLFPPYGGDRHPARNQARSRPAANQLESALLNLVLNARDAMPDGGHLLIETANTVFPDSRAEPREPALRHMPGSECVALFVTDTGTGMAPDVIARAFDPFYTTKPMGQGTGLGLSMIYGFVEQSGGQVLLRSEKDHGTTVTIYLPRHLGVAGSDEEVGAETAPPLEAASAVVLVVDDEPIVRMVLSTCFPTAATRCWRPTAAGPASVRWSPPPAWISWSPMSACPAAWTAGSSLMRRESAIPALRCCSSPVTPRVQRSPTAGRSRAWRL